MIHQAILITFYLRLLRLCLGLIAMSAPKEEAKLQAVVLADSFTGTFRPVTLDVPKVMLPLVNTPMIEYVMESLASSNVHEVG